MAIAVFAIIWAFRFIKNKTTTPTKEWGDDGRIAAWAILIFTTATTVMFIISGLGEAVSALINPEYWALKQILP